VLEQKAEIERLTKKGGEDQQAIALLETRLKNNGGTDSALLKIPQHTHPHIYDKLAFRLTEKFASLPSIDDISAELEVLKSEQTSLQQSLKESHEKETKTKKELEEKHAQAMAEMAEKLKASQQRVKTLVAKAKTYEAESKGVDKVIFRKNFMFSDISFVSFLFGM
jgi:Fe2+ transport system protein B